MSQLQAIDVIAAAKDEGQNDAYILLGRLTGLGIEDQRARKILRNEGYEIDELVDIRFGMLPTKRCSGGFMRQ